VGNDEIEDDVDEVVVAHLETRREEQMDILTLTNLETVDVQYVDVDVDSENEHDDSAKGLGHVSFV